MYNGQTLFSIQYRGRLHSDWEHPGRAGQKSLPLGSPQLARHCTQCCISRLLVVLGCPVGSLELQASVLLVTRQQQVLGSKDSTLQHKECVRYRLQASACRNASQQHSSKGLRLGTQCIHKQTCSNLLIGHSTVDQKQCKSGARHPSGTSNAAPSNQAGSREAPLDTPHTAFHRNGTTSPHKSGLFDRPAHSV